ncbi:MAG: efflux RND transporter periplasmic adaptor subunit [Thermoanaerobaculales bacterium]|jgi:HlyD family secretion protein|nr:efflux RND transporter periplasmic adaptor subunit [Thermoanaerobaculales bacterium]
MKKALIIGVPVLAVAVVAGVTMASRSRGVDGVAVELEPVASRQVVQTVTGTGKIQPMVQVKISADVSAKITRLEVKEGEWVEQGTLLVELDREAYLAAVESSEANLSAAQAGTNLARENMIKAEKDYARTKELFERSLESQSVLDSMYAAAEVEKARYQSTLDQVEQARAALRQARDALAKTTIYAPMSGTVSKLNKEKGEMALGSQFQADVILEISNLEGMEALVDIDENDIVAVSIGDEATIELDALPDLKLKGRVTEIANSAKSAGSGTTEERTEFEVKVAVTDPVPELRPGMTASAEIVTEVCEDCVSVPIQSVAVRTLDQLGAAAAGEGEEPRFTPDREGFVEVVWVVADGKAQARQVTTGIQSETHIEIVTGLAVDEQVVTGSYRAISRDLKDGSLVTVGAAGSEG